MDAILLRFSHFQRDQGIVSVGFARLFFGKQNFILPEIRYSVRLCNTAKIKVTKQRLRYL